MTYCLLKNVILLRKHRVVEGTTYGGLALFAPGSPCGIDFVQRHARGAVIQSERSLLTSVCPHAAWKPWLPPVSGCSFCIN
jgi:hypothetical protein